MQLDRIKAVIKWLIGAGYADSQKAVGELLGYKNESAFSQVLNGKKSLPSTFIDRLIAVDENINRDWVLSGKGDMLKTGNINISGDNNISNTGITGGDVIIGTGQEANALKERIKELEEEVKQLKEEVKELKADKTFLQEHITILKKEKGL